jgi:hypothetical protein
MTGSEQEGAPEAGPEEATEGPEQASRIQISIDAGAAGRFRITIEALDGEAEGDPGGVMVTLPEGDAEGQPAEGRWRQVVLSPHAPPLRPAKGAAWRDALQERLRAAGEAARSRLSRWNLSLGVALFSLSLILYLAVRLIGLADYPIYFFTDEAVQTVLAADLVRDNFFGYDDVFLPTYFRNSYQFNLSLSVYLQLIPYLLFGKSLLVTRGISVLVSLLAPLAIGLSLRDVFKVSYWWVGALVVSLAPAWFLHSRTAFETALATALYAAFLYLYLLYRSRSPRYLYPALVAGALVFYAYSPAQIYMSITGLLLLVVDARYHWQNRQVVLRGVGLALLLALPYLRFRLTHQEALTEHLRVLSSYWLEDIPFQEKLGRYLDQYLLGISPGYWFIPNDQDLERHVMNGYGHLLRTTLPFLVLGLILVLREIRQPRSRILLVALLAAPAGAATVEVGITRLLVFVIPASLLISLGICQALMWLERLRLPRSAIAMGLFLLLAGANVAILRDALVNGPTWHVDYGLHGMQYGARQVFGSIREYLKEDPNNKVLLSSSWANGADIVARFFLPDPLPVEMAGIDGFLLEEKTIGDKALFVLPTEEYDRAVESEKFRDIRVLETIPYPNGETGFYFVRMRYVEDIAELLAAERAERARLREEIVDLDGAGVQVRYSLLDMGQILDIFDGDDLSVTRTFEANPYVLELEFPAPRLLSGFDIVIGSADGEILTLLYTDAEEPVEVVQDFEGSIEAPKVSVDFGRAYRVDRMRVEILDETQGEIGHVHVWELELR